jgi:hypothetical protein
MTTLPPLDTTRRVFNVPVTYTVTATLYVLATDLAAARKLASATDLSELIGFDDEYVWVDYDGWLKFDDIRPDTILAEDAKPVSPDDYDPKDHPYWCPVGKA